jgi:hypothetical protein
LIYLPLLAGVLIPVHLIIEGYRWQMVPIYIFTAGLILTGVILNKSHPDRNFLISNKILRAIVNGIFLILFILSLMFPILLPVVDLPEPAGPFEVGTISYRLVDQDRDEIFTENPDDKRNLLVKVWYPTGNVHGLSVDTYWDKKGITGKAYSINAGMGTFWYSHLSRVKTNSFPMAPLSSEKENYPVIIYSPSFYGMNMQNSMLLEDLASYGYIIFSITHSYETIISVYPDGQEVTGDLSHISQLYNSNADKERKLYADYSNANERKDKLKIIKSILTVDELSNQLIKIRKEDVLFILDEIERINNTSNIFTSRLNLDQIGIIGWSFGGATAMEACIADTRIKAGINIDGWPYGELFNSDSLLRQPFLIIRSGTDEEMEQLISDLLLEKEQNSGYLVYINNATHSNFWDFPLFFGIYKHLGYWGPIHPSCLLKIENFFIKGFFDHNLKGIDTEIREGSSYRFPGVFVKRKQTHK